jgi:hypothetical protein
MKKEFPFPVPYLQDLRVDSWLSEPDRTRLFESGSVFGPTAAAIAFHQRHVTGALRADRLIARYGHLVSLAHTAAFLTRVGRGQISTAAHDYLALWATVSTPCFTWIPSDVRERTGGLHTESVTTFTPRRYLREFLVLFGTPRPPNHWRAYIEVAGL